MREGDSAPGIAGASFDVLLDPSLNNSGEIAFFSRLAGFGVEDANDQGIFTSQALVVRKGHAAPGIGNAVFSSFLSPALNDAGEVAFRAGVQGTGIDLANNIGPFKADGLGVLGLVVRLGDQIDIGGGE